MEERRILKKHDTDKKIFLDTGSWISKVTQWKGVHKLNVQNEEAQTIKDYSKMIISICL